MYIINNNIIGYVIVINLLNEDIIERVIIGDNPKCILYNPTNHKMHITIDNDLGVLAINTCNEYFNR